MLYLRIGATSHYAYMPRRKLPHSVKCGLYARQRKPDLEQNKMWDQRSKHLLPWPRERKQFGKFGPRRTNNNDMSKIQCFGCQEYGHYKRNCPKLNKDNNKKRKREEAHMTQEIKQDKKQKKEDPPDLYYD